jgi:membrane protease subunit HflK
MPWKQQGGGPWGGGGGQGPWSRGPSGPQPPNFEDLLRKGQDRVKRFIPGGFGGGRGLFYIIAAAIALWLLSGFYRVEPDEKGIVLRFGQYVGDTTPGLNYHLPAPIETVITPKVTRVNRIEIGHRTVGEGRGLPVRDVPEESLMLTGDENIVDIDFVVFWVIKDAGQFLFNIRNPEATVKVAAESAMREVVGQRPIQTSLSEGRSEVETATRARLQKLLDDYGAGVLISRVQLLKADPPQPVIDAFIDVQRARADLERLRNEAEGYRNDIIPRARGEVERLVQEARGYREEIINRAGGEAQRFMQVYESYKNAKDVTTERMYLETMEHVLRGMNKVIVDTPPGSQGVVPYLPLPELQRRAAPPQTSGGQQQ